MRPRKDSVGRGAALALTGALLAGAAYAETPPEYKEDWQQTFLARQISKQTQQNEGSLGFRIALNRQEIARLFGQEVDPDTRGILSANSERIFTHGLGDLRLPTLDEFLDGKDETLGAGSGPWDAFVRFTDGYGTAGYHNGAPDVGLRVKGRIARGNGEDAYRAQFTNQGFRGHYRRDRNLNQAALGVQISASLHELRRAGEDKRRDNRVDFSIYMKHGRPRK